MHPPTRLLKPRTPDELATRSEQNGAVASLQLSRSATSTLCSTRLPHDPMTHMSNASCPSKRLGELHKEIVWLKSMLSLRRRPTSCVLMTGRTKYKIKKPAVIAILQSNQSIMAPTILAPYNNQLPTAQGTRTAALEEVTAAAMEVAAAAMEVVAVVVALYMAAVMVVAAATPKAEAVGVATSATTHAATSTPAKESTRYDVPRELPTSTTTTGSPLSQRDYAISYYPRSSNLPGSPSLTLSKTRKSGCGATP